MEGPGGPWGGPGGPLGCPWGSLRGPWVSLGGPRGVLGGIPGGPWGVLGGPWGSLGGPRGVPGGSLGVLGRSLGVPRGVLGGPWALSKTLKKRRFLLCFEHLGVLGEGSGVPESLWGVLGDSLGVPGVSLGSLQGVLEGLGSPRCRPSTVTRIHFGAHRGSMGGLGAFLGRFWRFPADLRAKYVVFPREIQHFDVPKMSLQGGSRNTRWAFLLIRIAKIEAFQ